MEVAAQDKQLWDFALRDIARVFQTVTAQVTAQVAAQVALFCRDPKSAREIMEHLQLKHWKTFQENYLNPLIQGELLERTIPDKPTSRLQKYRLTDKGRAWLAGRKP
jgi:ATP-dependent DNA helicase RecG